MIDVTGTASSPSASGSASSTASGPPSVYFETQKGKIDASISWVLTPDESSATTMRPDANPLLPRATVQATTNRGDVSITTITRPTGLPLHLKVQAVKRGDARICLPPGFRGILALRYLPVVPNAPRGSYVALGASLKDQVVFTRETAPTLKGKGKQTQSGSQSVLVEFLIGADLEVTDLNKGLESGTGALDLVEAEVSDGRILILNGEDDALGGSILVADDDDSASKKSDMSRTWSWPGLGGIVTGGVTLVEGHHDPHLGGSSTGMSIIIEEPKWLGYARKKLTKKGPDAPSISSKSSERKDCGPGDRTWVGNNASQSTWRGWLHPGGQCPYAFSLSMIVLTDSPYPHICSFHGIVSHNGRSRVPTSFVWVYELARVPTAP